MELTIGERLRIVRTEAGLSQRGLAKKAGIGNATVSLIEGNQMNPSVSALKRILDAISVPLADFFSIDGADAEQKVFKAHELTEIGRGGISYKQIGKDLSNRALQLLHETYAPGADTGRVMLRHEGEEAGYVVSGRMELTVGSKIYNLGPGDAYYFKSTEPHRFRNITTEPTVMVSACTPPTF